MSVIAAVWVLIGLVVLAAVWAVWTYNRLVTLSRRRDEAWSGVMVQLKRRHDLVPNLVGVVKAYAAHEKSVLEEVARLRAFGRSGQPQEIEKAEHDFSRSLVKLMAVAENYPQLKADANFRDLQNSLVLIEDEIQMSRRYYNGTVRDYNTLVAMFPSMVVAKGFAFDEWQYFQLESPTEAETPTVTFSVDAQ